MPEHKAEVDPDQSWIENGTANVTPKPPMEASVRNLPLENHRGGPLTVSRGTYPDGLVIIPAESPPETQPATLPLRSSGGNEILIGNDDHADWPDGIVAWFTD